MDWINVTILMWTGSAIMVFLVTHNYFEYRRLAAAKTTPFRILPRPLLHLLVGIAVSIASPFVVIYYLAVTLILSLKFGKKFGGLLRGKDSIFSLQGGCVCYWGCIVEYDAKNSSKTFYEFAEKTIRQAMVQKAKEDPKTFGIVERGFGYFYLLKEEVTLEECLNQFKTVDTPTGEITKGDFLRLLCEYNCDPLPKNNKGFWEICVGTQPIRWTEGNKSDSTTCYPVVMKAQHSFADGLHVFLNMLILFADYIKTVQEPSLHTGLIKDDNELEKFYYKAQQFLQNVLSRVMHFIQLLNVMALSPATMYFNLVLMTKEPNLLDARPLTKEKIMCLSVEESPHYIQAVKRIKRKVPKCSFEDVFLAAFAASFSDYFRKHSTSIPDYVVAEMPAAAEILALLTLNPNETKHEKISCKNTLSVHFRKLPIGIACGGTNRNLLDTLEFIKKERNLLAKCRERQVYSLVLNIGVTLFPDSFFQMLLSHATDPDLAISNIPGPVRFSVGGGSLVKHMFVFPGQRRRTGIAAAIFSYDDRITLSLIVDKTIIQNEEELQNILDGVYKYIDLLDSAT